MDGEILRNLFRIGESGKVRLTDLDLSTLTFKIPRDIASVRSAARFVSENNMSTREAKLSNWK